MRKPCQAEGCDRPVLARGLCSQHYQRGQRLKWQLRSCPDIATRNAMLEASPHAPLLHFLTPRPRRRCTVEGCRGPHVARGWCATHYKQWQRGTRR